MCIIWTRFKFVWHNKDGSLQPTYYINSLEYQDYEPMHIYRFWESFLKNLYKSLQHKTNKQIKKKTHGCRVGLLSKASFDLIIVFCHMFLYITVRYRNLDINGFFFLALGCICWLVMFGNIATRVFINGFCCHFILSHSHTNIVVCMAAVA